MFEFLTCELLIDATKELMETFPDIIITAIAPLPDGVCFQGVDPGITYKYEYDSGCIYRSKFSYWERIYK